MGFVYMITNDINSKAYIGICIHPPKKTRIKDHLSGRGSRLVAAAVKKYGKDAFTYEILEADVFDEFLPDLEVAYIAKFNTVAPHGYNLNSGGNHAIPSENTRRKMSEVHKSRKSGAQKGEKHPFFGKTHTAATRRKMSKANKGRKHTAATRHKISETKKGKKLTERHRHKISETLKGRKHTAATRHKISEAHKGEKHPFFGKTHIAATRRKISEAKKHPDHAAAREYFFSLSPDMPLTEKRKLLFTTFSNVSQPTIYRWVKKWQSSD
ncbi:hypothetical protein C6499_22605 [Candidatus Poribacteria bacterium]|nr:MAG: hypothetical protein C6499_22605 [Candidatus Poribacteria bacterium]